MPGVLHALAAKEYSSVPFAMVVKGKMPNTRPRALKKSNLETLRRLHSASPYVYVATSAKPLLKQKQKYGKSEGRAIFHVKHDSEPSDHPGPDQLTRIRGLLHRKMYLSSFDHFQPSVAVECDGLMKLHDRLTGSSPHHTLPAETRLTGVNGTAVAKKASILSRLILSKFSQLVREQTPI
jgi:hypothetical protein